MARKRRQPVETESNDQHELRPKPEEQLLISAVSELPGDRILCTSTGRAQFAAAATQARPEGQVECLFLDLYQGTLAGAALPADIHNLRVSCAADLPAGEVDLVALPLPQGSEAELSRDLLQQGHQRLAKGGQLWAATDNRRDKWLGEQVRALFRKVKVHKHKQGVLYQATKTDPLKKVRDFSTEFVFRDGERLLRAVSRPGVFCHRRVDVGSRRVLEAAEIAPGERILDIGCGSGTLALALACRAEGVTVTAIDSNARAVECTARGIALNELTNVTVALAADGSALPKDHFTLVVTNPPYYSNFRIAESFVQTALAALAPGGRLLIVTKSPRWYVENLPPWFADVYAEERKAHYWLIHGRK